MAPTQNQPVPVAESAPPSKKRKPVKKPKAPAKGYAPTSTGTNLWTAFRSNVMDAKPVFHPLDIPRMLRDPVLKFGLNMLIGPMTTVQWEIQSTNPEIANFVENAYKRFWRHNMRQLAWQYFCYGYAPGIHDLDMSPQGELVYRRTRWVHPPDATALRFAGGERKGELAGFQLTYGLDGKEDNRVYAPYAFWFAGLEGAGQFHDEPRLRTAFDPWLEKNTRGGALHSRRLYFRTQAFRGQVIYHPDGYLTPGDASSGLNRDYALFIADTLENGTVTCLPDIRTGPDGKDSAWRIVPIEGNSAAAVDLMEYVKGVDDEMMKGLGIPPEVIEAAETGSGYSGRAIPMTAFLSGIDQLVGPMVSAFEPVVRWLVRQNYGDAEFTVDTVPLQESAKQQQGNPTSAVMGGQGDETETTGDDEMAGSGMGGEMGSQKGGSHSGQDGGGDPTAGGLVPYIGKHGGRGKKNPKTGRVYYLSHDGTRVGCLMAEIPDPLKSAVLGFASTIPDEELAEDGRESWPHVTCRHGNTVFDPTPVFEAVAPLGSLSFTPGELRVFQADKYDVLYVSCDEPGKFEAAFRATEAVPNVKPDHPRYVPHLTCAYLKRGKGKKYAGKKPFAKTGAVPIGTLVYAGPDDQEHRAAVWPSQTELDEMLRSAVLC